MKDAKGHGSDARGGRVGFNVDPKTGPTPAQKAYAAREMYGSNDPRTVAAAAHQTGVEKVQRAFDDGHHFESYLQHTGKDKLFRVDEVGHLHPPGAGTVAALRGLTKAGKVSTESVPGRHPGWPSYGVRYRRVK